MLEYICAANLLFVVFKAIWSSERQRQAGATHKHRELTTQLCRLERQVAANASAPAPPPLAPTYNSAERARVLALGRVRDGAKRHPVLDTPWVSVANPRDA